MKAECNKCGKCCYFPTGRNGVLQACPYLEKKEEAFHCKIYKDRLGKVIGSYNGREIKCNYYNDISSEIINCPLNKGNKPMRDVLISNNSALAQGVWISEKK